MPTLDEAKLYGVQTATGTALGWHGDWGTLFDNATIAAGQFDGRMLAWINARLSTSYTSVPQAMNAYAAARGYASWAQMGSFFADATLDLNFVANALFPSGVLTVTRASTATDLTFDQVNRTGYNVYGNNVAVIDPFGRGVASFESRTQYLGATDTPATQDTGTLPTGTFQLWVIGSGSATVAGKTATITGAGTATAGFPLTFTVTVSGTCTLTVSGSLRFFQLENGAFPTTYIPNAGAAGTTVVRAADSLAITGGNFTSIYTGGSSGTMYVDATTYNFANDTSTVALFGADDGTTANRISLRRANNNNNPFPAAFLVGGGVTVAALSAGASSVANLINLKEVVAYAPNDQVFYYNGGNIVLNASNTPPTALTQFQIGNSPGVAAANSWIRRAVYWPSRKANAISVGLTTNGPV